MTGETKIGLITGLSVIVLFAMILSHKGNGQQELTPPPRPAGLTTDSALDPVPHDLPGSDQLARQQPASSASGPDLENSQTPEPISASVDAAGTSDPITRLPAFPHALPPDRFEPVPPTSLGSTQMPVIPDSLRDQLEGRLAEPPAPPVDPSPHSRPQPPPISASRPDGPDENFVYIAQANDTLTSIARRFLGSGSRANVDRIFELNRKSLPSRNVLKAGQKLLIPSNAASARPASSTAHVALPPTPVGPYQVRPGDTLASIARHRLGDPARWHEIYELNKDRFPDPDHIPAGATIKVPARPVRNIELAQR